MRPPNARPRDGLGRPLPYDAPAGERVGRVPESLVLPPRESLVEAQRLLDAGLPFHAHEVLEGTWKAAPEPERQLWRGLAQLAVGLTHVARGNRLGGARLLRRGADQVEPYGPNPPYGIDATGLVAWARELADTVDPATAGPITAGPMGQTVAEPSTRPPRLRG